MLVEAHAADIQDRDGGGPLLQNHERAIAATDIVLEIVKKNPDQIGITVLPMGRRALLCMINRNRRL